MHGANSIADREGISMVAQAKYITIPDNQPLFATGPQLGVGGEGEVFQVSPTMAVKIFHKEDIEKELKVKYLIDNQAYYQMKASQGGLFALPVKAVRDTETGNGGYMMPLVAGSVGLDEIITGTAGVNNFHYKHLVGGLLANYAYLIKTGHEMGIVWGDETPANFRVHLKDFKVTAIDMDSPQYAIHGSAMACNRHQCCVGTLRYMAPEVMKGGDLKTERTIHADNHALAAIVFECVTGGIHYCQGPIDMGDSDELPPDVNQRIGKGWWPYSSSFGVSSGRACPGRITPPAKSVNYGVFGKELQELFTLAFDLGYAVPKKRPTAKQWMKALQAYAARLVQCPKNWRHWHLPEHSFCHWCELRERTKFDRLAAV